MSFYQPENFHDTAQNRRRSRHKSLVHVAMRAMFDRAVVSDLDAAQVGRLPALVGAFGGIGRFLMHHFIRDDVQRDAFAVDQCGCPHAAAGQGMTDAAVT